jgi:hypothetical protein
MQNKSSSDSADNFKHLRAETLRPEPNASENGVGTAFSNVEMR